MTTTVSNISVTGVLSHYISSHKTFVEMLVYFTCQSRIRRRSALSKKDQ